MVVGFGIGIVVDGVVGVSGVSGVGVGVEAYHLAVRWAEVGVSIFPGLIVWSLDDNDIVYMFLDNASVCDGNVNAYGQAPTLTLSRIQMMTRRIRSCLKMGLSVRRNAKPATCIYPLSIPNAGMHQGQEAMASNRKGWC